MGQYYQVVNLDKKETIRPHAFGCGAKLMEHSWIGNKLTGTVMELLSEGGAWHKTRMVWAGDYADEDLGFGFLLYSCDEHGFKEVSGDAFFDEKEMLERVVCNHTKSLYVRLDKMPKEPNTGDQSWRVFPISLLVSLGNGRGGGDYREQDDNDYDKLGSWAGDVISVETLDKIPEGFTEMSCNFKEW